MTASRSLDDFVRARGADPAEVLRRWEQLQSSRRVPPLSAHDQRLLRQGGLDVRDADLTGTGVEADPLAVTLADLVDATAGYPTVDVAANNGVTASRVRHWKLLTVRSDDGTNRYLRFQFDDDGRLLPGIRQLVAAMPATWSPLSMRRFLDTQQRDLELPDGTVLTPRQWLTAGLGTAEVLALIGDEGW